jgi:hypothetical protein
VTSPTAPDPILQVSDEILSPQGTVDLGYCSLLQGVVTAINSADNTFTATLGGDTSATVPGIKSLMSYQPTVGDTVMCLKQKTDVIGLGKMATTTAQAYGQASNVVSANNVITSTAGFFTLSSSPNSVTLTKRFSTSNLFVNLSVTGWADVISGGMTVAVNIGGTDYICGSITLDRRPIFGGGGGIVDLTQRVPAAGSTVISGIPAGSVTAIIRIRNNVAGSNLHVDTGDFYSLTVQEVL